MGDVHTNIKWANEVRFLAIKRSLCCSVTGLVTVIAEAIVPNDLPETTTTRSDTTPCTPIATPYIWSFLWQVIIDLG